MGKREVLYLRGDVKMVDRRRNLDIILKKYKRIYLTEMAELLGILSIERLKKWILVELSDDVGLTLDGELVVISFNQLLEFDELYDSFLENFLDEVQEWDYLEWEKEPTQAPGDQPVICSRRYSKTRLLGSTEAEVMVEVEFKFQKGDITRVELDMMTPSIIHDLEGHRFTFEISSTQSSTSLARWLNDWFYYPEKQTVGKEEQLIWLLRINDIFSEDQMLKWTHFLTLDHDGWATDRIVLPIVVRVFFDQEEEPFVTYLRDQNELKLAEELFMG